MDVVDVSIIVPVHNADKWISDCLQSILDQNFTGNLQVSIYDDGSTDDSLQIVNTYLDKFKVKGIHIVVSGHKNRKPYGVGWAKNKAVQQSCGRYLCFQDADDVMLPSRIQMQWECALRNNDAIVGCKFKRDPSDATKRFTNWANSMTPSKLVTQVYTSHGPTVIMPTWFCSRETFLLVGGFSEDGRGTPEDLIFFYHHLDKGGKVAIVEESLLVYRHHPNATTFSISESTIWNLRFERCERNVIANWTNFTIWNAGKQGRRFYRSLSDENKSKVVAFCDVDLRKIGLHYTYEYSQAKIKPKVPIVHFTDAKPPFIICVKLDLTNGQFESNLASLHLTEGVDYIHFN